MDVDCWFNLYWVDAKCLITVVVKSYYGHDYHGKLGLLMISLDCSFSGWNDYIAHIF